MWKIVNKNNKKRIVFMIMSVIIMSFLMKMATALPTGPTSTFIANETKGPSGATLINTSGGSITTVILNTSAQNLKWKAFVGNVTGTLTLDDTSNNTIFDWSLTDVIGEIYSTRYSGSINWSGINCSN